MTPPGDSSRGKRPTRGATKPRQPAGERARRDKTASSASDGDAGILSSLPSTRPQRPSARRAAAKRAAARSSRSSTAPTPKAPEKRSPAKPASLPLEPPIPRQGFETEDEIEQGAPIQPPSRPELAGAVAELLGELAQTGIVRSGRLFKDVLGRLPGV